MLGITKRGKRAGPSKLRSVTLTAKLTIFPYS